MRSMLITVMSLTIATVPVGSVSAKTWYVNAGGTGDALTIQAGIDSSAAGDTVEVACGTYSNCVHSTPEGELNCVILKSGVVLISESDDPACVTIDAQSAGRVVYAESLDATTVISGFTLTGGLTTVGWPYGQGAGLFCRADANLEIRNCLIESNHSTFVSGGLTVGWASSPYIHDVTIQNNSSVEGVGGITINHFSSPTIEDCLIQGNTGANAGGLYSGSQATPAVSRVVIAGNTGPEGGGVVCNLSSPTFNQCTVVENIGHGLTTVNSADVSITSSIIADNTGLGVYCYASGQATLQCSNLFGNGDGDWVDCLAGQEGTNDNFSSDPLFCNAAVGDFALNANSPCAPGNHPDGASCGLVGALPVACGGSTATEEVSWGEVKEMFR